MINNGLDLKHLLADWEDQDTVQYYLGCCLGIYEKELDIFRQTQLFYLTGNPIPNMLYELLKKLVEIEALEFDEDEAKFRWNKSFKSLE